MTPQDKWTVKQLIREALGSFFSQTKVSRTDESGTAADTIVMDDGVAEPVARLEQYGDVVVPPGNVDTVYWHNNQNGVQMPLSMERWRPSGDRSKAGTRGLYSSTLGTVVILHGAGSPTPGRMELDSGTPDGAPQEDVRVNGGTLKVARETDQTNEGTLTVTSAPTVPPVPPGTVVRMTYTDNTGGAPVVLLAFTIFTPIGGVVAVPAPGATTTATVKGKITTGADHFKG